MWGKHFLLTWQGCSTSFGVGSIEVGYQKEFLIASVTLEWEAEGSFRVGPDDPLARAMWLELS
jgi:hypothetical protein